MLLREGPHGSWSWSRSSWREPLDLAEDPEDPALLVPVIRLVSVDGGDGHGQRAVLVLELVSPIVLSWPALLVPVLLVVESGVVDGQHVDLAPVVVPT